MAVLSAMLERLEVGRELGVVVDMRVERAEVAVEDDLVRGGDV